MQAQRLRIGTRGSPLALAQAHEVQRRLVAAHGGSPDRIEIVVIKTSGDRILDRPLAEIGGKGLFTKEIQEALLANEIDLAVHSMKDMETRLHPDLSIGAVLPREDVRDAFISKRHAKLKALPAGAVVGTSSLRRAAQLKRLRPDIRVVGLRGNVQTRLGKLEAGDIDATFLAVAGLKRLGMEQHITEAIEPGEMLPAVAQGAIALEIRAADSATAHLIAALDHAATRLCVTAERAFLAHLDGSCRTPIAALAVLDGDDLRLIGELLADDGSASARSRVQGATATALALADKAAREVLAGMGRSAPGA